MSLIVTENEYTNVEALSGYHLANMEHILRYVFSDLFPDHTCTHLLF